MQAVQSAYIFSIATGLATEALSVGAILNRQLLFIENHIAIDIGDRHLSGRNKIEIVETAVIHLSLFVGQLTCAIARSLINNRRRHNFSISRLRSLIEEELDKSALQPCPLANIYRETGTCNLHTEVEINEIIFLCKLPMRHFSLVVHRIVLPLSHSSHFIAKIALHH